MWVMVFLAPSSRSIILVFDQSWYHMLVWGTKVKKSFLVQKQNIKNHFADCSKMMCNIWINPIFRKMFPLIPQDLDSVLTLRYNYPHSLHFCNLMNSIFLHTNQIIFCPPKQRSLVIIKSNTHHKRIESARI